MEQFIIIDLAYNWNEKWVDNSNKAEEQEAGSGKMWLTAILMACGVLYFLSAGLMIYMFVEYTGCPFNTAVMVLTLVFCIVIHGAQLSGEEGSLLASAIVSTWAWFLCYTAVSRNPNAKCNPRVGETQVLPMVLSVFMLLLSLGWTGWSYTAEDVFRKRADDANNEDPAEEGASGRNKINGIVTGASGPVNNEDAEAQPVQNDDDEEEEEVVDTTKLSNSWRLNLILALIACWTCMTLTKWGEISTNGSLASATAGKVSMWMVIGSQWLSLSLYLWTLVAPRLFPDRDFS